MLSYVNIDAICVSCLSSSVYFSWVFDKNDWHSLITYHHFVNSATFFSGMRLFRKWWRWAWLRWRSWCWLAILECLCGPSSLPWNLVFCSLSQLESVKTHMVVSPQRTTCIHLGCREQVVPCVCFIQKRIQDGIIRAQQCPAAVQIPDIGTKALPRVHVRILYRSTS